MPEARPYRLSIACDLERFRPELEYAADFLDGCHYLCRQQGAKAVLHYGHDAPPGAIAVPAALFPQGVRTDGDGIHPDPSGLARMETNRRSAPLLPTAEGTPVAIDGTLAYDALGLIFLLLSRLEERDGSERDRYGRFPYRRSLAARRGFYGTPLADVAARDIAAALLGQENPASRTSFAVLPTHDADRLRGYHRPFEPLRQAAGDIVKRRRPAAALRRLRDGYAAGEPWRSVRLLMDLSERHGLASRFFFMGPSHSPMDSTYAAEMAPLLRRVADEIRGRGHAVGFHPGFGTADDEAEWLRQKQGLEAVLDGLVTEGRQHVLGYRADITPDIWDAAGMEVDFTPAFPEATGFRTGTCRRHPAYSLRRRRSLRLMQHSTAVIDFGLFGGKYRDLPVDQALAECLAVADQCRAHGGSLVMLYHTGLTRPPYRRFYEALLARIA